LVLSSENKENNPFLSEEGALHSIATGVIASDSCNPHEARKVGDAAGITVSLNK